MPTNLQYSEPRIHSVGYSQYTKPIVYIAANLEYIESAIYWPTNSQNAERTVDWSKNVQYTEIENIHHRTNSWMYKNEMSLLYILTNEHTIYWPTIWQYNEPTI